MATSLGQTTTEIRPGQSIASHGASALCLSTILRIGLIAGTLDIGEDFIFDGFRGATPAMIFRYIASALIGSRLAERGPAPVLLGAVLHYLIALSWTALFYVASRRLAVMTRRPVTAGLIYGALVYVFMNAIVLRLAGMPPAWSSPSLASIVNSVLAVVLCIGLTISLLIHRASARA